MASNIDLSVRVEQRPNALEMFVVYARPSDFPGKFVVRRWFVDGGEERAEAQAFAIVDTLEEARAAIPPGLARVPRFMNDDPVIVEVWL